MGRLKKHLGIPYSWKMVKRKLVLVANMNRMEQEIIETYEKQETSTHTRISRNTHWRNLMANPVDLKK